MCSYETPQHGCHRLGTSPCCCPPLLSHSSCLDSQGRRGASPGAHRCPACSKTPSSVCGCWLCPRVLPDASRGATWLPGWHTPLAWDRVLCTEPGKQGGVEVFHLQELVHSFVTRLKVHMAFMHLELLFLALVPTISPVLETILAGTARITSITAKHEKSCKKFIILPMKSCLRDDTKIIHTNLRDKTCLAGPCSLVIQDNVVSSLLPWATALKLEHFPHTAQMPVSIF